MSKRCVDYYAICLLRTSLLSLTLYNVHCLLHSAWHLKAIGLTMCTSGFEQLHHQPSAVCFSALSPKVSMLDMFLHLSIQFLKNFMPWIINVI